MHLYWTILGIGLLILVISILLPAILRRMRSTRKLYVRDAALSNEDLWDFAKKNAIEHSISLQRTSFYPPILRMKVNYEYILSVYSSLNADVRAKKSVPPAAEWLLDNFYMIEEQMKQIRKSFRMKNYRRLPILKTGPFQGYARIFSLAMDLVSHTDGPINEELLTKYVESYQSQSVLYDREIWAFPVFLKLALIETIRNLCEKISNTQQQWHKADAVFEDWMDNDVIDTNRGMRYFQDSLAAIDGTNPLFIEHLFFHLRRSGRSYISILQDMNQRLSKLGTTTEEEARKVHSMQSLLTMSIGNCISSLRYFSTFDWTNFFDATSMINKILLEDPDGTYLQMDVATRYRYRSVIEETSLKLHVSEIHLAKEAIELSKEAKAAFLDRTIDEIEIRKKTHVGYYIVGDGKSELISRQKSKQCKNHFTKNIPRRVFFYVFSIAVSTILLTGLMVWYELQHQTILHPVAAAILIALIVWNPIAEITIQIVNWLVCKIYPPTLFPRLALEDGIPSSMTTLVVIPALLPDVETVHELLRHLEKHYLANREKNLYFALVGAFKDSREPQIKDAEKIIQEAFKHTDELNKKYCQDQEQDLFFFFHRKSQFNKKNNTWIGWERKRGALLELNDLILGYSHTSFCHLSCKTLPPIKYVITLDSDTILPLGTAKKLIATMAHPLNQPLVDYERNIVTDGYAILQPRIEIRAESANKSLFSEIFTGQKGIDPYANAVSDVYQDLFEEGIYTGKGIYDVAIFQKILKMAIPDNTVLSHDLLEGSFVRTGLVTDLRLMDSYPSTFLSYSSRLHRWVRGDWQLLPFFWRTIRNRNQQIVKNPLSFLSKWKMFDNLRRSLITPTYLILLLFVMILFPNQSTGWLILFFVSLFTPFLIQLFDQFLNPHFWHRKYKHYTHEISGLKAVLLQSILQLFFLPYTAGLMLHAISISLVRIFITKKNTLQWTAAAMVEKYQNNKITQYLFSMSPCILFVGIFGWIGLVLPSSIQLSAIGFGFVWFFSPFIGYLVSQDYQEESVEMTDQQKQHLRVIARKTWRYFEEFMNEKNHYLPPDNYQTDPPRGLAYRTSPTNIGLGLLSILSARDFGFIPTTEMVDRIEKTLTTIETIEKWNGHLPNWIDTRSLASLQPTYISTVDSGNLLSYLITLREGLKDYIHKPLVELKMLQSIRDTLFCAGEEGFQCNENMMLCFTFPIVEPINLASWQDVIDQLVSYPAFDEMKDTPWKSKVKTMVQALYQEFHQYFPSMELFRKIPLDLRESKVPPKIVEMVEELRTNCETNYSLEDLPAVLDGSIRQIESIEKILHKEDLQGLQEGFTWLTTLKNHLVESHVKMQQLLQRFHALFHRISAITDAMDFIPLYSKRKQLFSIGYALKSQKRTPSYYDLLASEARQTSYICIAKGIVPPTHWFRLDRTLTTMDGYKGLISWTGTMFEYLMPLLIMQKYKHTLLDESYAFALRCQMKYAKQRNMPWGSSESAFYSLDKNHDYQYKAIGIPWLGLKRGLINDAVVAPYATFLALMVDPIAALRNLEELQKVGLEGAYGFYEAADYTPERLTFGNVRKIVKTYMSHHQGMSFIALNNLFHNNVMQKRFHQNPCVDTAALLLQEKSPVNFVLTKDAKKLHGPEDKTQITKSSAVRSFDLPNLHLPKVHVLSNGNYSILLTDKGTGYSRTKMMAITRWREDLALDSFGTFFYIRNVDTDTCWSATYAPLKTKPDRYSVVFSSDKAIYNRRDGDIETQTEVVITSGDPVEIRRITLRNTGNRPCLLEITSYSEVVLTSLSDDIAHPSFSNLFVQTDVRPDLRCLLATRRPRAETDKSNWLAHAVIVSKETYGDIQYETDRMKMIGRGNSVQNPVSIETGHFLSSSVGAVLDPVMSLRVMVRLEPKKDTTISFVYIVGASRESVITKIQRYSNADEIETAFQLALTRSNVETNYLNLDPKEVELYQNMLSHIVMISPSRRQYQEEFLANRKGQSGLWRYGISGDNPIVLVHLKKDESMQILYDILQAHEYWHLMDVKVDLIILVEEEVGYNLPLKRLVSDIVSSREIIDLSKEGKDIFILVSHDVLPEDISLFYSVARMILRSGVRSLQDQLSTPIPIPPIKMVPFSKKSAYPTIYFQTNHLKFFNGLGGFSQDAQEYQILLRYEYCTPAPWINVISNDSFGFLVTDLGSGFTWFGNSRENKLTPWSNDVVSDPPGEVFYVRDEDTAEVWSLTPSPIRQRIPYRITHGFGYSMFEHSSHGLYQKLTQFIVCNQPVKISMITLRNDTASTKTYTITNYIRPVLGVSDQNTAPYLRTFFSSPCNLLIENPTNEEFPGHVAFLATTLQDVSMTGDRQEFFGSGSLESPEGLRYKKLSGNLGFGYDPCAAVQGLVQLQPNETRQVVFIFGMGSNQQDANRLVQRYRRIKKVQHSLTETKQFWQDRNKILQVQTPDESMDVMMNGWLPYQIISCRLWARSAFYQSGGAFGFRDQLQDCISIAHIDPTLCRKQILLHAQHQFVEGDVQHWWHEPSGKGTRTRISDDRLWLPYATAEYIRITEDWDVLREDLPYLESPPLKDQEEERYEKPSVAEESSSLYEHCIRAIEISLRFGSHGLPLMGTGDWNDGMNAVGIKGKGESVWLGWFLYSVLNLFIPLCQKLGDEERASRYRGVMKRVLESIEKNGWDGNWYRRAFFDNGTVLGSIVNTECKIDSIAQSWAVISGGADPIRASRAMQSVEDHLILRENGIITLLYPPFDQGETEPGYIKSYLPGVRENGGQYTHAAAWVMIAFAKMGQGNKAWELFSMLNPIHHTNNLKEYSTYKTEPYVVAADVYSQPPNTGRGGWTWYTGSASWLYRAGLEYLLGFQKHGDEIRMEPCIPTTWEEFSIKYQYHDTLYHITVLNPEHLEKGVKLITMDGLPLKGNCIPLFDDHIDHNVKVFLGSLQNQEL